MLGVGHLYFEKPGRGIEDRIRSAEVCYLQREGAMPEYVEINPEDAVEGLSEVDGVPVRTSVSVITGNIFTGRRYESSLTPALSPAGRGRKEGEL